MRQGLVLIFITWALTGCATFGERYKAFLNRNLPQTPVEAPAPPQALRFSDNPNMPPSHHRQYRRVNRDNFEEEALMRGPAGSLWVMEGQGAYLFSQNIIRMIGDPLAIKLEGDPRDQLENKAKVIRELLTQLENRQRRMRQPAAEASGAGSPEGGDPERPTPSAPEGPSGDFNVNTVPTRVIERLTDGNYRVKGSQPLMIGNREYQVIVTGIVRAEDFDENGISATRLLDSRFDIVGTRRRESSL